LFRVLSQTRGHARVGSCTRGPRSTVRDAVRGRYSGPGGVKALKGFHGELGPASRANGHGGAEYRQANRADESDIDNVLMTKTRRSKVNLVLSGNGYDVPQRGRREERHHQVLQEGIPSLEVYVRSSRQVCSLLKEHRFLAKNFADVDGNFLIDGMAVSLLSNLVKTRQRVPISEQKISSS